MKATVRQGLLGYTLSLVTDVPRPAFRAESRADRDRVAIRVSSAAINPIDYKLPRAAGGLVVGKDVCGTVEAVGADVGDSLRVGDVVYGTVDTGSLAEYAVAKASAVAKYADGDAGWTTHELAALPVAYQSALQCLRKGNVLCDDDDARDVAVLVVGASGGCGVAGVQLCRAVGVGRIVAVCSGKNAGFVREAGATEMVDYTDREGLATFFRDNVGKFDCVLDAATNSGKGEDYWNAPTLALLKQDKGIYTALNGSPSKWMRRLTNLEKKRQHIIMMETNTPDLETVVRLLDKINARPSIDVVPFTEEGLADAFQRLKGRRTKGKLVFDVSS